MTPTSDVKESKAEPTSPALEPVQASTLPSVDEIHPPETILVDRFHPNRVLFDDPAESLKWQVVPQRRATGVSGGLAWSWSGPVVLRRMPDPDQPSNRKPASWEYEDTGERRRGCKVFRLVPR